MQDITIVTVNYRMKSQILKELTTLFADLAHCPYQANIVIVDNSENKDGIKEVLSSQFPQVHYIDADGNVGFSKGNNIGFTAFPARYYFALNPDTRIPTGEHAIERLITFMDQHPDIGAAGPKLNNTDGSTQDSCYQFNLASMFAKPFRNIPGLKNAPVIKKQVDRLLMKDFDKGSTRPVDWVLGAALLVRHEAVQDAGWFDERYFMYLEDCDWCHTLWTHGWPVYYLHSVTIEHAHARDSAKVPSLRAMFTNRSSRMHLVSWCRYMLKWKFTQSSYAKP